MRVLGIGRRRRLGLEQAGGRYRGGRLALLLMQKMFAMCCCCCRRVVVVELDHALEGGA